MTIRKKRTLMLLSGVLIGFINGFFGGGGGMIAVPVLSLLFKLETKKAHATALGIILPVSIVSFIIYLITKSFYFDNTMYATIGVVCGGIVGAVLLKKLKSNVVKVIFLCCLSVAGVRMIIG